MEVNRDTRVTNCEVRESIVLGADGLPEHNYAAIVATLLDVRPGADVVHLVCVSRGGLQTFDEQYVVDGPDARERTWELVDRVVDERHPGCAIGNMAPEPR